MCARLAECSTDVHPANSPEHPREVEKAGCLETAPLGVVFL